MVVARRENKGEGIDDEGKRRGGGSIEGRVEGSARIYSKD